MKIGITERGDAAISISQWEERIKFVDFAILITKNPSSERFLEAVKRNNNKVMVHATITGLGGSKVEPNVKKWKESIQTIPILQDILDDPSKVVLRVDPIVPTNSGSELAISVMEEGIANNNVKRIRYSFLDMYSHVKQRFQEAGIRDCYNGSFNAPKEMQENFLKKLSRLKREYINVSYESCAENTEDRLGCVSNKDAILFNSICSNELCGQRHNCLCTKDKTELLTNASKCWHGCLYCYWK